MRKQRNKWLALSSVCCLGFSLVTGPILTVHAVTQPMEKAAVETSQDLPNSQQLLAQAETTEENRYFFQRSRVQGVTGESIKVTLVSQQAVAKITFTVPAAGEIVAEELPVGLSVNGTEDPQVKEVVSSTPRNTFVLPVSFSESGSYTVEAQDKETTIEVQEAVADEVHESVGDELVNNEEVSEETENSDLEINESNLPRVSSDVFNTIIYKDFFLDFFDLSGNATYDEGSGIVTLTRAINNQSGAFYLKYQIDKTYPFILKGSVFLGEQPNSADGIGFGLHTGESEEIGLIGSGFGMAGLPNVFGFKLDTYFNGSNEPPFAPDPPEFQQAQAFGAFVHQPQNGLFQSYMGNDAPGQAISRPDGQWKEFELSFIDGEMSILFDGKSWIKDVEASDWIVPDVPLSFLVSGSTGGINALQQFRFESFAYSRNSGRLIIEYIDIEGNTISNEDIIEGLVGDSYSIEPKEILGYSVVDRPENERGIFTDETIVIKYLYEKQIINPADPLDPEKEINPDDSPEIPEEQGLLSLDFVSQFRFGQQRISAQDRSYYAQPQRILDGNGQILEDEERPNYVQVSDRRGIDGGWELMVTQNHQFMADGKKELAGAAVVFHNQEVASAVSTPAPLMVNRNTTTLIPGNATPLMKATNGRDDGQGTWLYRFGDGDTANESVELFVPKSATPDTDHYQTTFTWMLQSVPE